MLSMYRPRYKMEYNGCNFHFASCTTDMVKHFVHKAGIVEL